MLRLVCREAVEFHVAVIVTLAPAASEPAAGDTDRVPAYDAGTTML
jgi:hypothetical protein